MKTGCCRSCGSIYLNEMKKSLDRYMPQPLCSKPRITVRCILKSPRIPQYLIDASHLTSPVQDIRVFFNFYMLIIKAERPDTTLL